LTTHSRINWWTPVTMVFGITATVMALMGLGFGETDNGGLLFAVRWLVSAVVLLAGLAVLRRRPVTGSWMVIIGAALFALGDLIGIPIALFVIIGGLWTGNLVTSEGRAARLDLAPRQASLTEHWYRWLMTAAGLGALGFLVLIIWPSVTPDNCTEASPCWEDSLAWAAWILSWMSAFITAGIGVILGSLHFVVRHRTRPA
jgi:hypothetical protein